METNPVECLNFFKLYCGMEEPLVTVEEAASKQHKTLLDIPSDTHIPRLLDGWLWVIDSMSQYSHWKFAKLFLEKLYEAAYSDNNHLYHPMAKRTTVKQFVQYWSTWWKRLHRPAERFDGEILGRFANKQPYPELYVDYLGHADSKNYQKDAYQTICMLINEDPNGPLSPTSRRLLSSLFETTLLLQEETILGYTPKSLIDGCWIGEIHHIPKKGTVKRRAIACGNRFVQQALVPCATPWYNLLRGLPKDCTFQQDKLDGFIKRRLERGNYVGSVDLSQATDNLPYAWGLRILQSVEFRFQTQELESLYNDSSLLFHDSTRAFWYNDGYLSRWTVGQPLGTLPSFALLGITNNILLEAISALCGFTHSPYGVLGDDTVMFHPRVRDIYIRIMRKHNVPLSIHKSYEDNLVEFAGKVFVKGFIPFFCSDQSPIYLTNLFDYQRSTTIWIPYSHLPKRVQRGFKKLVTEALGRAPSNKEVHLVYHLAQELELMWKQGSCSKFLLSKEKWTELIPIYWSLPRKEEVVPEREITTGITPFGDGFTRFAPEEVELTKSQGKDRLPDWFVSKYRPVTTVRIVNNTVNTLLLGGVLQA
jgi:hypothetical protein